MKFKVIAVCIFALLTIANLKAQELKKGTVLYSFSSGASFANLSNSKAPHNLFLWGSDDSPVASYNGHLSYSPQYFDYQPDFFQDIKTGFYVGGDWEYFLQDNFSVNGTIAFESKGIKVNFNDEIIINNEDNTTSTFTEIHNRKINNNYLTMSFTAKKYFAHQVYIEGGIYGGKLISSAIDLYSEKSLYEGPGNYYESMVEINGEDRGGEFTSMYDLGITTGFGFQKFVSEKIFLRTGVRTNIGLLKVDSKYNNEYEELLIPQSSNIISTYVRSTNYYGFNSNAKNINILITFGVGWMLK